MDRMLRVNELLKRELGQGLERLVCGRVNGLVTITEVKTAPDLRSAIVFVSVYGKDESKQHAMRVLHQERTELQKLIARNVKLKFTPKLEFRLDEHLAQADHILQVLEQLEQQDKAHGSES